MHEARTRNPEARTDAGGRARFDALPPGGVYVQAMPVREAPRGIEVELVAGRETVARFELKEGHLVTGTVRDRATRQPIAGAEVSSWDFYDKNVRTNVQGQYRIEGVDPGGVDFEVVSARAPGYGRVDRRVSLASGAEPVCDFELTRALTLRGRVVDGTGAPIAGAYVAASGGSRIGTTVTRDHVSGRTRDDGRFELADLSREMGHALFLRAPRHETRTIDVPAPAADAEAIDVGDLGLGAGAGLEGVVVSSSRVPVPRALLVLQHMDASPLAAASALGTQHVYADAHGRFRVAELAAGRHSIRVHVGGYTDSNLEVELGVGELRRGMELELKGGGALAGVVVDERAIPVEDAEVHVAKLDSPRWIGRSRTAGDGSFRIEGLPDETLRIGAQRFEPLENERGELVRLLPSAETEVQPFTTDLRIVLPRGSTIEGRILAADGTALIGGCVEAFDSAGRSVAQAFGRDGDFKLLVPAGATVRLVGFRQTLDETGRFRRVPMPGEEAVVEGVTAGARDVIVRFAKIP
jgi:protocatechuate 3,4-dioxygenase beta subunit